MKKSIFLLAGLLIAAFATFAVPKDFIRSKDFKIMKILIVSDDHASVIGVTDQIKTNIPEYVILISTNADDEKLSKSMYVQLYAEVNADTGITARRHNFIYNRWPTKYKSNSAKDRMISAGFLKTKIPGYRC